MREGIVMKRALKLFLISGLIISTTGTTIHGSTQTKLDDISAIAQNAPKYLLGVDKSEWKDVTSFNKKPLFNFNGNLVAYSVDIKSNISGKEGYIIISATDENSPILEFSQDHTSPFDIVNTNQECIYDGAISYYLKGNQSLNENSDNNYYDIQSKSALSQDEVKAHKEANLSKKYVSSAPKKSKAEREKLIVGSVGSLTAGQSVSTTIEIESNNTTSTLLGVPDYEWRDGCSPTAAAMVLKYDYYSVLSTVSSTLLIDQLAKAMSTNTNYGTKDYGKTSSPNIPVGINAVMNNLYGTKVNAYNEGSGGTNTSTFAKFVNEINNARPLLVNLVDCMVRTPEYPTGFGEHSVTGVGYDVTSYSNYIIVHDTAVEGNVYVNYESALLGVPTFTYIH